MIDPTERKEIINYTVSHYLQDPARLIVVFASAGLEGLGEPVEEFKNSLLRFGPSLLFIVDRKPSWYNHPETLRAFDFVVEIASRFAHVGALGESMGGSGALNFCRLFGGLDRVLALSPQYSVAKPFIEFNRALAHHGKSEHIYWSFAPEEARSKAYIVYGNTDWQDAVNSGMFLVEGFNVHFVDGAGHSVAQFLKRNGKLLPLIESFVDFSTPFSGNTLKNVLGELYTEVGVARNCGFGDFASMAAARRLAIQTPMRLPPPLAMIDLALGKATDQSSISRWSKGKTTKDDSARAVSGRLTGSYAFHTDFEERPWWSVDLSRQYKIGEIRIYNRLESHKVAERGSWFSIEVGSGDGEWREVWRRTEGSLFGGADGKPFIWRPEKDLFARYVRLRLLGETYLHYDSIEVFGPDE